LQQLNEQGDFKVKLFFLQRHGEGYHNVATDFYTPTEWNCYWQLQQGNSTVLWLDAELTSNGIAQINQIRQAWFDRINMNGLPIPESFYVSPLRRTLHTWDLNWKPLLGPENYDPEKWPIAKEFARETYGVGTESKRHNKDYIMRNYPFVKFEGAFSRFDELWRPDVHESSHHRKYRSKALLDDIFANDDNLIMSLVTHSGLIKSILKVVHHRKFLLKTGQMIPVVIKRTFKRHPTKWEYPDKVTSWKTVDDYCGTVLAGNT
jgi:broad specificity phosphatase PhoE